MNLILQSIYLLLQVTARECWQRIGDKCDWLDGRGPLHPSAPHQRPLGGGPSVGTQCSAHIKENTKMSNVEKEKSERSEVRLSVWES